MAIGMMFLVMALTIILLTNSLLQVSHAEDDLKDFEEKIALYEVGEYVLKNKLEYISSSNKDMPIEIDGVNTGYMVVALPSVNKFVIKDGDDIVLTIEIDTDGKITSWN